jgi:NAD(P)-dependent dehydrogenase (short-subunit alcohol dehydrogenase family)
MTRHMASDLGTMKIRVNAIAPGTIRTNLTGARLSDREVMERESGLTMLNRVGETEDIVGPAVFLASDESSFITGTHIFVDGGYSVK